MIIFKPASHLCSRLAVCSYLFLKALIANTRLSAKKLCTEVFHQNSFRDRHGTSAVVAPKLGQSRDTIPRTPFGGGRFSSGGPEGMGCKGWGVAADKPFGFGKGFRVAAQKVWDARAGVWQPKVLLMAPKCY
jgi:hypothetical protein